MKPNEGATLFGAPPSGSFLKPASDPSFKPVSKGFFGTSLFKPEQKGND